MKCNNCGTEFEGNFCPECGTPAPAPDSEVVCANCGAKFKGNFCPQCGKPAKDTLQTATANAMPSVQIAEVDNQTTVAQQSGESRFTGGAFANFFIGLLTDIVSIITLFLAYPAMLCWQMRWETEHTYINGRQLTFDGKARQIYGKYILWLFLSIITLGIYYIFCMRINLIKWQTKHTHILGVQGGKSEFTGGALGYFGHNLLCAFVTTITLTLGIYWAKCHMERWLAKNKVIDGVHLCFDGKALQYFGKILLWAFLTVITLFIYSFWLIVKSKKWIIKHTKFAEGQVFSNIENSLPIIATASQEKETKRYINIDKSGKKYNIYLICAFVPPLTMILFGAITLAALAGAAFSTTILSASIDTSGYEWLQNLDNGGIYPLLMVIFAVISLIIGTTHIFTVNNERKNLTLTVFNANKILTVVDIILLICNIIIPILAILYLDEQFKETLFMVETGVAITCPLMCSCIFVVIDIIGAIIKKSMETAIIKKT